MSCTWLTVQEAANHLRLDRTTLYKYIREGKLKVSRPGGTIIRICLGELNRLGEEPPDLTQPTPNLHSKYLEAKKEGLHDYSP